MGRRSKETEMTAEPKEGTPRTDAAIIKVQNSSNLMLVEDMVPAELSRQFERELAAARAGVPEGMVIVAQVMRAMAKDGKCGPVAWIQSPLAFPDGTNLYVRSPSADAATHTDHPLRHWDRTCPACIAESAAQADARDAVLEEWISVSGPWVYALERDGEEQAASNISDLRKRTRALKSAARSGGASKL